METPTMDPIVEIQLEAEIKEMIEPSRAIILYNDDVNNFCMLLTV